ncbi:sulfite exporter TauE/SafE family protein [Ligilactobacillus sp. WILCCON 0076]|uniref:Probable membrane transporter protein n=1 Tax=Ligilactobacillus ubinensis TaxID=2876789 RepID=A0A9X2JMF2_9LACO|nr:sulfite exporter TauE/SafE family protein [Ligilactobacillus ubinensis]MCP0887849.1 sulfite exporter TauE/SafE family protein [Ligilactobacillus ubinensis]
MILIFVFLIVAGFLAGLMQSVAGLASLVSYPALLIVGVPPVIANVTNTTALIFSGIGSTVSSARELKGHGKKLAYFIFLSLIGSVGGSLLLLHLPSTSFEKVVPFFIFGAGILLLLSSRKKRVVANSMDSVGAKKKYQLSRVVTVLSSISLIFVGGYTGYFGAAGGVLFLAILSLITDYEFPVVNAIKNVIGFVANLTATFIFIAKSHIVWLYVVPMGIGLLVGGYTGPIIVRHINIHLLRILIAFAAFGLAIYLFVQAY